MGAAAEHAVRLLTGIRPAGVVLGGDRALVAALLEDDRLAGLRDLPRASRLPLRPVPTPA